VRSDWHQNNVKENVMFSLLKMNFNNTTLGQILVSTGSKYLVEHNPVKGRDNYWSDDCDGTGQNQLGQF